MSKICDNKSVGIVVWKDDKLLMIERKKYNPGFAIPAGHQDGDDSRTTAIKELSEEVGLFAEDLKEEFIETFQNTCKRENGTHHQWTIFITEKYSGEIKTSEDEVKNYVWVDEKTFMVLLEKLEEFVKEQNLELRLENLVEITKRTNESDSWKESPGLEPVMYFIFEKLAEYET